MHRRGNTVGARKTMEAEAGAGAIADHRLVSAALARGVIVADAGAVMRGMVMPRGGRSWDTDHQGCRSGRDDHQLIERAEAGHENPFSAAAVS